MPTEAAKPTIRSPVLVDLALQGGGSHGAFTWGVLDRFLEEPWLEIDGISGTSAGAMNAAVLVHGHQKGGRSGAREALEAFWRRVSRRCPLQPVPAWAARCDSRPLVARFLAHLCRHGPHVARRVAIRPQPDRARIHCARFLPS